MATTALRETEADFQQAILDLAGALGWRCYHTHDSRHSAAGFPDLTLVRGERLIFAELKAETGRLSTGQREWLEALASAGAAIRTVLDSARSISTVPAARIDPGRGGEPGVLPARA